MFGLSPRCPSFFTIPLTFAFSATLLSAFALPAADGELSEELPRIPPREPAEALRSFEVQQGFRIELVASEPVLSDPVDACFDAAGRIYVAEMHGYPYSEEVRKQQPEPIGKKDAGVVRLLTDKDGDGVYESSSPFATGISWPTSVCCYDDGVFVLAPSKLYYFKDTDGDGVADVRKVIAEGFSRANVQGLANNLKWGPDYRIYGSGGTNGGDLKTGDGKEIGSLRGRDFCFDPRTGEFELIMGGRQFGHSFDNWGRRFVCTNSNHIQLIQFPLDALERSTTNASVSAIRSIAKEGPAAPVFRRSPAEPWRIVRTRRRAADPNYRKRLPPTELVATGFFTSATGVTIYRGDAYPTAFHGNAFIGDVGGNLIHRKTVGPQGASLVATRADQDVEFVTSDDTWFRPVNFVNGPDGCLYVLDMYRETIEHPVSIPEDIKAHLHLESGDGRGRIYRLAPPEWKWSEPQRLDTLGSDELVPLLTSTNAWHRETAGRLLVERHATETVPALRELALTTPLPVGRRHLLDTLMALGAIEPNDITSTLAASDPELVAHAIKLAEPWLATADATIVKAVGALTSHADLRVRFQLALSLGVLPEAERTPLWTALASSEPFDSDLASALLLSLPSDRIALLDALLTDGLPGGSQARRLALTLVTEAGSSTAPAEHPRLARFLQSIFASSLTASEKMSLVIALGQGLQQRSGDLSTLAAIKVNGATATAALDELVATATQSVANPAVPQSTRLTGIRLLTMMPFASVQQPLSTILTPQTEQELQVALVESLGRQAGDDPATFLIEKWPSLGPAVQRAAADACLARQSRTELLLQALKSGTVPLTALQPDQWTALEQHPVPAIRKMAAQIHSSGTSADRAAVIAEYREALEEGSPELGRAVYQKHCALCHRVAKMGHGVGPDLVSVRNKSVDDLLVAILDPSREAQPNFTSYTIATDDGRVFTGIIAAETSNSVTLRRAEGKQDTIPREQIEILRSNGVSLMPSGVEKTVSVEDMGHLIAFIRNLGRDD